MAMNTRTSLGALCAALLFGATFVGACSSDSDPAVPNEPSTSDDAGIDASDPKDADPYDDAETDVDADTDTDADTDADADADVDEPDGAVDGGDDPDDAAVDASDPEAGPTLPDVECVNQSSEGAYSFNQSANKQALTPGGVPELGRYTLTRWYDGGTGSVQGTASVFREDDELFLRMYLRFADNEPIYRTLWMQAESDGSLRLTELCAPEEVGTVWEGIFEMREPPSGAPELWIEVEDSAPQMRFTLAEE